MTKLVVLRLEGDLSQEVQVTLEIGEEDSRPSVKISGSLPSASDMTQVYGQWQYVYLSLGRSARIKAGRTIIDDKITLEKCLENAEIVRSRLNKWLESESFRGLRETWLQELKRDEEVRVLISTSSETLRRLPWQLWDLIEDYPKSEVALSATQYKQPASPNRPSSPKKVRILAILGDSTGIDVHKDKQLLENLPHAAPTFLVEPQPEEIRDKLWEYSWDILFFAGHSGREGETDRIYINKTDSLTIADLKNSLKTAVENGLQLAIFNSCDGLGLAGELQHLRIPQLIVMREAVPDEVAQKFLKYFLKAFTDGEKFYLAARTARRRLRDLEQKFPCASWMPVILQHPAVVPPIWNQLCGLSSEMHKERQPQQVKRPGDVDVKIGNQQTTQLLPNTKIRKKCNRCGATNPDAANFCLECAFALTDAVAKSPLPPTVLPKARIPKTVVAPPRAPDTVVASPSQEQQQTAGLNDLGSLYDRFASKQRNKADILFVFDCTGSMQGEINAIRDAITDFAGTIESHAVRARVGLIEFRDRLIGEEQRVHLFDGEPFTDNPALFRQQISCLRASGGGDEPESSLDALLLALNQPFDASANKVIVLITDAPPHIPDVDVKSIDEVVGKMRDINVDQMYVVMQTLAPQSHVYFKLLEGSRDGKAFDIGQGDDFRVRAKNFKQTLMSLGKTISRETR